MIVIDVKVWLHAEIVRSWISEYLQSSTLSSGVCVCVCVFGTEGMDGGKGKRHSYVYDDFYEVLINDVSGWVLIVSNPIYLNLHFEGKVLSQMFVPSLWKIILAEWEGGKKKRRSFYINIPQSYLVIRFTCNIS